MNIHDKLELIHAASLSGRRVNVYREGVLVNNLPSYTKGGFVRLYKLAENKEIDFKEVVNDAT